MRKTNPLAAFMQNEGDEPGGHRFAELTTGSEAGARRNGQSIGRDLEVVKDADLLEAGTELGSSDPINSAEVGRGSPDQAHQPWCDISVPEQKGPSWQEGQ
jgi:hypothetical protein